MGHLFTYYHYYRGALIAGDFIKVRVTAEGIDRIVANWHEVEDRSRGGAMPVAVKKTEAVSKAVAAARAIYRESQNLSPTGASLCYYAFAASSSGGSPRPAWRVVLGGRYLVYIDARTGVALNHYMDRRRHSK